MGTLSLAASRLQHVAQVVHQQEFLNGGLDRRQEALERLMTGRLGLRQFGTGVLH
jgi:hypothetical protein